MKQTPWEREQLEYQDKKSVDSMEGARLLGWFGLGLLLGAVLLLIFGCSTCPGDDLRVVQPVTWHELSRVELSEMCLDWDQKLRGCIVSRPEGDHVYTLPVAR